MKAYLQKAFLVILVFFTPLTNITIASTATYVDQILTLPEAILLTDNHYYKNIKMRMAEDGRWDIIHLEEASIAIVDSVDVQLLESSPIQVDLVINGYFPDSCTTLGNIVVERRNNCFHVIVLQNRQEELACATVIVPYSKVLSLKTDDLNSGLYEVKVNDKTSEFELQRNPSRRSDTVCCKSYCCTCSPDYWQYSYDRVTPLECQRPEDVVGGNCYEIVDDSYCPQEN